MLSIPFYLAFSIFLAEKQRIIIEQPYIVLYIFGVFVGAMLLFYTYIYFAEKIAKKVSFIANLGIPTIVSILSFV